MEVSAPSSATSSNGYDQDGAGDEDAETDITSYCSSGIGDGQDLVEKVLAASNHTYGDVTVKDSYNVQFGNNTYLQGPVTLVLSSSKSITGIPLSDKHPELLVAAKAALEADSTACKAAGVAEAAEAGEKPSEQPAESSDTKTSLCERLNLKRLLQWPHVSALLVALAALLTAVVVVVATVTVHDDPGVNTATSEATASLQPGTTPYPRPDGLPLVTRDEWLAKDPAGKMNSLDTPVEAIIIHHSVTSPCFDNSSCRYQTRLIQKIHMGSPYNFFDIGYNFLAGGDGAVYEGRGWNTEGAHLRRWNARSIGIAFIGTFTMDSPTSEQVHVVHKLIEWGVQLGKIRPDYKLISACQLKATESPGRILHKDVKTWDHWWEYYAATAECRNSDRVSGR